MTDWDKVRRLVSEIVDSPEAPPRCGSPKWVLRALEPTAEEVAVVLDEAHDVLLTRGWTQGTTASAGGQFCAVGAIAVAAERLRVQRWRIHVNAALARSLGLSRTDAIPVWNDKKDRTIDEVLDALRAASKALRNGEIDVATLVPDATRWSRSFAKMSAS